MHDGNRGERNKALILAITVATIVVASYAAMFISAGYQSGYNDRKAKVEARHYANDAAKDIERSCGELPPSRARECIGEIITAQRENERSESDLAAQWESAEWAKWAGVAALAQLLATVIGLYYIKGTLDETRKAVEDTSEATDAMRKANEIALDGSRAWMRIDDIVLKTVATQIGDKLSVVIMLDANVSNVGNAPALEVSVFSCAWTNTGIDWIARISETLDEAWAILSQKNERYSKYSRAVFQGDKDVFNTQTDPKESSLISCHTDITADSTTPFSITGCVTVFYKTASGSDRHTTKTFVVQSPLFANPRRAYETSQRSHRFEDAYINIPTTGIRAI
ncbi:hypothetical protein [Sphingopyxis terrae]|uniref:hypothetical protein n=1 Tax=Sphingopyxis terrae TaxID=33052 RepID=UPI002A0D71C4|nr:hypothetical protein [Sphingopyxis terrae]MDX8356816.1 hypothetical protein [Sphingopyxis terrae]